ncbi:MAG: hypothetical protein QP766_08160 [Peptoniphilus lacrimalis]|nr:hypothetical protein [Peptoniphilus lacrimalis]
MYQSSESLRDVNLKSCVGKYYDEKLLTIDNLYISNKVYSLEMPINFTLNRVECMALIE